MIKFPKKHPESFKKWYISFKKEIEK